MSEKTLLAMRHAKSSWKNEGLTDFDRPLNKRGQAAAPFMAEILAERNLVPQLIISSSAERAKQTSLAMIATWSKEVNLILDDSLYLAGPNNYLQSIALHAVEEDSVMVVGHNPGMEFLIDHLAGEDEIMPTAAVAILSGSSSWQELNSCNLHDVLRPKDLSSDL